MIEPCVVTPKEVHGEGFDGVAERFKATGGDNSPMTNGIPGQASVVDTTGIAGSNPAAITFSA